MNKPLVFPSRRLFLGTLALGLGTSSFFTVRGAFAEELSRTPRMTEGPFYPDKLPLDTDNDLIFISGHPGNKRDGVFLGIRDPIARELVLIDFKPLKGSKTGELSAQFDIVVGLTPKDPKN